MALNFPDSPATNDYFTDNTSGFTYQWNGYVWISVGSTQSTTMKEFDDISGSFNGSTTTFELTFGSGTTKVYPFSANQITITLGGILQNAGDDFTISGNEITFTTAPIASLTFAGMFYGSSVSMNSAAAGSIGTSALTTGGPVWNTGGDVSVAGIVTVGSSSVVIDGPSNEIKVGTGATINESGITAGIITASAFYGDGSNLEGVNAGIGTTGSANTTGIITASYFYGAGIGLTNIGGPIHAISYSPGIGATGIGATSNIVVTFNKPVKANTGTITLKEGAADGTTVESFDVVTSDRITISGGQITIDPTDDLSLSTSYYVAFPAGAYKDILDTTSTVGISTYSFETEVISNEFPLWGWGRNSNGELAQNDNVEYSSPVQIPGTNWTSYSEGMISGSHVALKSDGTLWVWGKGTRGKLGLNEDTSVNYSSPVQVPGNQWNSGINARYHCLGTKTDGTLWVWGGGNAGSLGLNDTVNRSSPTQIPGTQWEPLLSVGRDQHYIKKTDGTFWSWGYNNLGTLGFNNQINYSSPKQIPGTNWVYMLGGYGKTMATKTDGTLWVWGYNGAYGQLGQNNRVDYSSPVQIPGTEWNYITSTAYNSFATKTDGTLWAWGNDGGVNGINDIIDRSSPTQIPGTQWSVIEGGRYVVKALKTDGTLWTWGYNNTGGQLGLNDIVHRSSPAQIPGTQWSFDRVGINTGSPVGANSTFVFKTPS